MNRAFQILEHPADIGFRAFADSLPQLFENAGLALLSIASEVELVDPRESYSIDATAADIESLLVTWLSEVLYLFDGKRIAFHHFQVSHAAADRLTAVGLGEPWDPARHQAKLLVKAVTWHQLRVAHEGGRWIAEVYLDV